MTDKELLELSAKAAGYTLKWGEVFIVGDDEVDSTDISYAVSGQPNEADWYWNPLIDDGDALRLAVKLYFLVEVQIANQKVVVWDNSLQELRSHVYWGDATGSTCADPYAATRRAIVKAAAEIGKAMA